LLFLVPFEIVGVLLLGALLLVLVEPWRVTRWRIERDSIRWRSAWFGCGWWRSYRIVAPVRLELRLDRRMAQGSTAGPFGYRNLPYQLAVVDPAGATVCRIKRLSEGEARWLADGIHRARPSWFAAGARGGGSLTRSPPAAGES
jgi:hypothetical protein